jgi:RNA polymerase sigma-70 factor (ECF subfamily)
MAVTFHEQFVGLFEAHYRRLFRYLNRLTGDGELAADLVQEAFIRLYERGEAPDAPGAWLISVAMNLFRNEATTRRRRKQLLTVSRGEGAHSDPVLRPDQHLMLQETSHRVRGAIESMPQRERHLLLLRAEGFSYREIAGVLELNEASVGVLLARAKRTFRDHYRDSTDASH